MEGGADIGAGVAGVEPGHHRRQKIIPGEHLGPQILAGGEEDEHQQSPAVGQGREAHHPPEGPGVGEKGVDIGKDHEGEPE